MSAAKTLSLIGLGYVLAVIGGVAAVAVNELRMSEEIAQGSPGMAAFGDVVLFILATGFISLAPTWLLLRLAVAKAPRALFGVLLFVAAIGPLSWLAMIALAGVPPGPGSSPLLMLAGPVIAFGAIPRIIAGPVVMMVEGATILLARRPLMRVLLAAAIMMDLVPLTMFVVHMARAVH